MVAGLLAILVLTQTGWGQSRVLGFALNAASGSINGELTVRRLGGNLLSGARLYGISIRGPRGAPFLQADSAFIDYDIRTLASGDIALDDLVLFDPELYLTRLPSDTLWNYERIFPDTADADTTTGTPTVLDRVRVVDGRVEIRLPWEPDEEGSPAERRQEVREALADTSRLMVGRAPGGFLRTIRFASLDGTVSRVVVGSDEAGGTSLRVDRLSGLAQLWRDPLRIRALEGEVALRDGQTRFRVDPLLLPRSRASVAGVYSSEGEEPSYDVVVAADRLAFMDLQPIFPTLPDRGGGELLLSVETRPDDGLLILAPRLNLVAPGTRLRGSFGMVTGDTLRFVDANLRADPLRVSTMQQLLPADLPVRGLFIGGVEIQGASSPFRTTGRGAKPESEPRT